MRDKRMADRAAATAESNFENSRFYGIAMQSNEVQVLIFNNDRQRTLFNYFNSNKKANSIEGNYSYNFPDAVTGEHGRLGATGSVGALGSMGQTGSQGPDGTQEPSVIL